MVFIDLSPGANVANLTPGPLDSNQIEVFTFKDFENGAAEKELDNLPPP